MAQPALPLAPLLARIVAPLTADDRLALVKASQEPDFSSQLRDFLWSLEGQSTLVSVAERMAPRSDNADIPGFLASLSAEQLAEARASMKEEERRYEAHLAAGGRADDYDPSVGP